MENPINANVCRCCLAQGAHKDLSYTYTWFDKKEVYASMLHECFNIVLSTSPYSSNSICDSCVSTLRSSCLFKQNVLHAEEQLMKQVKELVEDEKPPQVKLEPVNNSDDDSDDYFLADAVREVSEGKIKLEVAEPTKKKTAQKRIKKSAKRSAENIEDFVSRLGITKNKSDGTLTIKKIKPRKLIISDIFPENEKKIKIKWSSRMHQDKFKHRGNLQTILQFSNATPFKDKSLLGYSCGYCEAVYPDPADLRIHNELDHQKERLNYKSNFDLTDYHVKVDVSDLMCTLCDENLDNLTVLKEHLKKVHSKEIFNDIKDHILQFKLTKGDVYNCALCSATYETFKMLKQHMNVHYSNYTCSKCDSAFATKRSLNAHRSTHLEGSFPCDHCEKVFASKAKKNYHLKMKHMGARNVKNCPFCNEPFRSYYQRNQHLIKVHNSEAQYKCNICDKTYILKSLLMYHIKKNHLMERNCQCTECGYRFFSKKALKAHMVKHTGERNYQCEVCHKSYARKYTLREHMRIHNNDRRFKCEVCSMSFVQKCSLKSHLLSNHGISMQASDITVSGSEISVVRDSSLTKI